MNKKGIFISLTAILILLIILGIFLSQSKRDIYQGQIDSEYREHKIISDYVNDLQDIYMPTVLSTSMKFGLQAISTEIKNTFPISSRASRRINNLNQLEILLTTGSYPPIADLLPIQYQIQTLAQNTAAIVNSPLTVTTYDFRVLDLYQKGPFTVCMDSQISFIVQSNDLKWTMEDKDYSTCTSVNAFWHPMEKGACGTDMLIQESLWSATPDAKSCYLLTICQDPPCDCNEKCDCGTPVEGICPSISNGCSQIFDPSPLTCS